MHIKADISKLKKNLILKTNLLGFNLTFNSRWGVFSPRTIDEGTLLLLKHIDIKKHDICLDLGCGYGAIGLAVAKICTEVHMVDKDFIAIELSNYNARLNNINNAKVYLSDAFSHVVCKQYFTKILSNVPAKVGREQLSIFLYDAFEALKKGGVITFVTINGLRDFIKHNFKNVFGNYKKLKQGRRYTVAQAIK